MTIKVVTLNIEHGGKLMDNILAFIKEQDPDVLFLQEVYNSHNDRQDRRFRSMNVFKKEFSFLPYSDFKGIANDPDIGADMGNAIFSKFRLSDTGVKFFDVPYGNVHFTGHHDPPTVPRAVQSAFAHINNSLTLLLNLHGIWGKEGGDNQRRIDMANDICEIVKGHKSIILAGDTNFTDDAKKTIEIIESSGVESIFKDSLESTFNMQHKTDPGYATAAVDMIFVSKDFKVVSKEMPMVDVSDHYPLKAVLEIEN